MLALIENKSATHSVSARLIRLLIVLVTVVIAWESLVIGFDLPPYLLPSPHQVAITIWQSHTLYIHAAIPTLYETLLGFLIGCLFACLVALLMVCFPRVRLLLMPIILVNQTAPHFVLAPLLVVWFGFGLTSKIITCTLVTFFPVVSSFYDGLMATPKSWCDQACVMHAKRWKFLRYIQIPAALPRLASGVRIAASIAPIGALVGEWVGSSQGLGYLLMLSHARVQIDVMFGAVFMLVLLCLSLYYAVDISLRHLINWNLKD